jgi:hypothetical protein
MWIVTVSHDFFPRRAFAALAPIWERLRFWQGRRAPGNATIEATETDQGNGVGALGWVYRLFFGSRRVPALLAGGFHDLAGKLIRVSRAFV